MGNTIGNLPESVDDSGEERLTKSNSLLGGIEVPKEIEDTMSSTFKPLSVPRPVLSCTVLQGWYSGWLHERL